MVKQTFSSSSTTKTFLLAGSLYHHGMNGLDLNNINSLPLGFLVIILSMVIVVGVLFLFFKKKQ